MDINKVLISGIAITAPVFTKLHSEVPSATFILQIKEAFRKRSGQLCLRPNNVRVEGLGKTAEMIMARVREGARYTIDGYLRHDRYEGQNPLDPPKDDVRVRAFAVTQDDSTDNEIFQEGLTQALSVLRRSRDLTAAIESLEEMLRAR